jgi:hypothetical protein
MNMAGMAAADGSLAWPFGNPAEAADPGAPILAELRLDPAVGAASDVGRPLAKGDFPAAMDKVAAAVAAELAL